MFQLAHDGMSKVVDEVWDPNTKKVNSHPCHYRASPRVPGFHGLTDNGSTYSTWQDNKRKHAWTSPRAIPT